MVEAQGMKFNNEVFEIVDAKARAQLNNIANELKLVAGENNTIKLMLGTKELSSLTISGGTVEPTPIIDTVVGSIDENKDISLTGLDTGTYTLKYEDSNGNVLIDFDTVAIMEVV